mgnify:CR=1
MLIAQLITIALLYYQVTMPSVENAKYTTTVYNGQLIRMNTQNGTYEVCDANFKCEPK